MQGTPIRVGIIGISPDPARSWATRAHVPALRHLPDFELRAVCAQNPETAQATADHFGVPLAFSDPAQMAAHPDVDLVVVAVKAPLHFEIIGKVLPAGKAVFCEWPLGVTTREAQDILEATERAGVVNLIGLQGRCSEALNYVRDLIDEGFVGRVTAVTLHVQQEAFGPVEAPDYAHMADVRNGATLLTIGAGHALSAMCHSVGAFRELSAIVANKHVTVRIAGSETHVPKTAPDQILISGVLQSGAVASVHLKGGATRTAGNRLEINGTEGDLLLCSTGGANLQRANFTFTGGRGGVLDDMPVPERYALQPPGLPPGDAVAVAHLYDHYARQRAAGERPSNDFRYAVGQHELLDAIQRASDTGHRQFLEQRADT